MLFDFLKVCWVIPLLMVGGVLAHWALTLFLFGYLVSHLVCEDFSFLRHLERFKPEDLSLKADGKKLYKSIWSGARALFFLALISVLFPISRMVFGIRFDGFDDIFWDFHIFYLHNFLYFFSTMLSVTFVLAIFGLKRRMADQWFKKLYLEKEE